MVRYITLVGPKLHARTLQTQETDACVPALLSIARPNSGGRSRNVSGKNSASSWFVSWQDLCTNAVWALTCHVGLSPDELTSYCTWELTAE